MVQLKGLTLTADFVSLENVIEQSLLERRISRSLGVFGLVSNSFGQKYGRICGPKKRTISTALRAILVVSLAVVLTVRWFLTTAVARVVQTTTVVHQWYHDDTTDAQAPSIVTTCGTSVTTRDAERGDE